jgi:Predicted membrane protein (DUF2207)
LLFALAVLALPGTVHAQSGERIRHYDVDIRIQRDGLLLVTERIDYDFDGNTRHGIFRDIPDRYAFDQRFDRVYPIDVVSVEGSPGTPSQFKESRQSNFLRIQIGDPNTTITGLHTYTITYRVRGALNGFSDHDELYLNAVGPYWEVPIDDASTTVTAPAGIQRVACFAGPVGSSLPCDQSTIDGRTAAFGQPSMNPGDAFTVVVAVPRGAVQKTKPILEERSSLRRAFDVTPVTIGVSGALLVLVLGGFAWLVWSRGRDLRSVGSAVDVAFAGDSDGQGEQRVPLLEHGPSPVQFAPPDDIRPGQVGTLVDERANPLDVTATIVDLAVRGHLRIEEIPKEGWFGHPDWRLVRLDAPDDQLLRYEQLLMTGLFNDADQDGAVQLSSLKRVFAERLKRVENALYDDAMKRRWFAARPDKVRDRWHAIGIALLVAGGVLTWLAARAHLALIPLPLILAGLLVTVGSKWMPRRTPKGTGMVRRVLGFRTYIATAETQRARFEETANIFSKYLPYAIVFGLTEKWAQAFSALGEEPLQTSWYVGPHPFTVGALVGSMDSFSTTATGSIASTPSSTGSSGFGGGGFSGGGGGGGGGGSW